MAYIYEHIRTKGFEPMHFEEHYVRLDTLARRLFVCPFDVKREELKRQIAEVLRKEGFSAHTQNAVYVRYYSDGRLSVEGVDTLYSRFSLRAIRPHGYICRISGELLVENTSAKEAMLELNGAISQTLDGGVPIWVNEQGEVLAIDGSPVIAVFEDEIRFSRMGEGVEFDVAYATIGDIRRKITKEEIRVEQLCDVKELLCVDYRGVTALESFESHRYVDIIAERIAMKVADAER